jgi:hypothetical protein
MDVQKELRLACQIEESNAKNQEKKLSRTVQCCRHCEKYSRKNGAHSALTCLNKCELRTFSSKKIWWGFSTFAGSFLVSNGQSSAPTLIPELLLEFSIRCFDYGVQMGSHMNCLFTLVYDLKHVIKKMVYLFP